MKKITKVIHLADIHLRNYKRHDEYRDIFQKFLNEAKDICDENTLESTRIVIVGDLLHQKITVSNEQLIIISWFLRECNNICKTIIIAGNHDFLEANKERVDSITPIIKMLELPNVKYLDMELGYEGGFYEDENVMWSLFSVFDDHNNIDIKLKKIDNPDKVFISLFHGMTVGLKNDNGFIFDSGKSLDMFDGSDVVMCGDVHCRQEQNFNGIKIVQPGSLIQQDKSESAKHGHGYMLWDISDKDNIYYEERDIESDYGFYKFRINSIKEIEDGVEEFINF